MKVVRATLVGIALFASSVAVPAARAASGVDQQCEGRFGGGGSGGTYTQTFTPTAPTLGRVDVLLMSQRKRGPDPLRLRVVRKRSLGAGLAAQVTVLAEQQIRLPLEPRRQTWAVVRLPAPVSLASTVPLFDQIAIELVLPEFDNTLDWVGCSAYSRGQAASNVNGGPRAGPRTLQPYGLDSGVNITQELPLDLAFITYSSNR